MRRPPTHLPAHPSVLPNHPPRHTPSVAGHKAKNFSSKESQATKVSLCVLELQRALPRARIVYCSATGVSEVGNMAYMTRLGLWGPGSAFINFEAFLDSMKRRWACCTRFVLCVLRAGRARLASRGRLLQDARTRTMRALAENPQRC